MIEEQLPDDIVLDAEIRQLSSNELSQLIVVVCDKDEPIYVFGHGDFDFLLLVPLYVVDLHKNH